MTTSPNDADARPARAAAARAAREALLLSQDQLAKAAGVSVSTIARLERGSAVSPESLKATCAVLGIDARALNQPPSPEAPPESGAPHPEASGVEAAVPGTDIRRAATRIARRSAGLALLACACAILCLVARDAGIQTSGLEIAPYRKTLQANLTQMAVLADAREANAASVLYSSTLPPSAPDRDWEPWQRTKPMTWLSCHAPSLLAMTFQGLFGTGPGGKGLYATEPGDNCRERSLPQRLVRRDAERTDLLVGPLTQADVDAYVALLTGDPSVRIRAALTPTGDVPPDGPAWFDPRAHSARPAEPGDAPRYLLLRMSREA